MEEHPLDDGLVLVGPAVYLTASQTLVVADLQLGLEQQLRDIGDAVPRTAAQLMLATIHELLAQTGAKRLLINGDLKHEFGRINAQERDIVLFLRDLRHRCEVVVVKGNHDTVLAPLLAEADVPLYEYWSSDGVLCIHGHRLPDEALLTGVRTIIIGHVHPAVRITDGVRSELCKCFLVDTFRKRRLVVLPSLSWATVGTDILQGGSRMRDSPHSPFLQGDSSFVFVLDGNAIRPFGRVSDLRRILG